MAHLKEHNDHVQRDGYCSFDVVYMGNDYGDIQVEACTACDYKVVTCIHSVNKWNSEETVLTCSLCGADGT